MKITRGQIFIHKRLQTPKSDRLLEAQLKAESMHLVIKNQVGTMLAHSTLSFGGSKILKDLVDLRKLYAEIFLEKANAEFLADGENQNSTVIIEPKAG